ncbi:hypothetical protein DFH28DRAFT_1117903 [Melampsora americana]|nr:hypothetical protein DFH28DRAFT_1117903 [Melampsora americana]
MSGPEYDPVLNSALSAFIALLNNAVGNPLSGQQLLSGHRHWSIRSAYSSLGATTIGSKFNRYGATPLKWFNTYSACVQPALNYESLPMASPSMSNLGQSRKRNHPLIASGLFDILSKVESDGAGQYAQRQAMTTIGTINNDTGEVLETAIKASGYGGPDVVLNEANVYSLKGRLLALNKDKVQVFYYEADTVTHVTESSGFRSDLTGKVSVTGLGLIVSHKVEKITSEKDNVTIIVRHNDFNPDIKVKEHETFNPILKYVISGINITSGHETAPSTTLPSPGSTLATPGGRAFIPGSEEGEPQPLSSVTASKAKVRAPAAASTGRQYNKKPRPNSTAEDSLIDPP